MYELHLGDCLEVMRGMADASVDLIATDPPYFKVKDEPWDHQWDTREGFLAWIGELCEQWQRILKPNGSLYVFASPQMAWHVEGVIRQRFNVLNTIRWVKDAGWHRKADRYKLRGFLNPWEAIIFAEHNNPIGHVLRFYRENAGVNRSELSRRVGVDARLVQKWEERDPFGQRSLMTRLQFVKAMRVLGIQLEMTELIRLYDSHVRPFHVRPQTHIADVWHFDVVLPYPGKHPCEKPLDLIDHIIKLSSNPGDTVLDCFAGSGTTAVAALKTSRNFIGCEISPEYHAKSLRRLQDASAQLALPFDL